MPVAESVDLFKSPAIGSLTCNRSSVKLHGAGSSLKDDSRPDSQEIPCFYGTRRFITVFKRARHWTLSWTTWIQYTPSDTISLRSVLSPTSA